MSSAVEDALQSTIFVAEEEGEELQPSNAFDYEADRLLIAGAVDGIRTTTDEEFFDRYSQINAVSNESFADAWKLYRSETPMSFEEAIGKFAYRGHARDNPVPFRMECTTTPGCIYKTPYHAELQTYARRCNPAAVDFLRAALEADDIPADDIRRCQPILADGKQCPYTSHMKGTYGQIRAAMEKHGTATHDWRTAVLRRSLTCTHPTPLKKDGYLKYLTAVHQLLKPVDRLPYLPGDDKTQWDEKQACVLGYASKLKFRKQDVMVPRLVEEHAKSEDDAEALVKKRGFSRPKFPHKEQQGNGSSSQSGELIRKLKGL
ncbi:hypothetical protein LTR17_022924 [Elasticomyces elasticus]|nr:hypothetical protein LTR17_022924 [Elasticomyces elasticus]